MTHTPVSTGHKRFLTGGLTVLLATLVVAAWAAPAEAHRAGKAEPRIAAALSGEGLSRILTVRLSDLDSGDPVEGATVVAVGPTADGAVGTERVRLREVRPAVYRTAIEFSRPAAWRIRITVTGEKVVTAEAILPARIEAPTAPASTSQEETEEPALAVLPTTFDDELTGGDYTRMAFLWVHSLAAMGWIVGVLVMVVALSTRPGVLAETARNRLAGAYRSWGGLVHWGLVPAIVGTGIYNMLEVTPFELAWTPGGWDRLSEIPYGLLYESILLVKLGFFALLLVTGTMTFLRTVQLELPVVPVSNPHPRFVGVMSQVLGPAGLVYLATVPLILAAAMALRYVHILNHVAVVTGGGHG